MVRKRYETAAFNQPLIINAIADAFRKLDPRSLVKNPVMFVDDKAVRMTLFPWRCVLTPMGMIRVQIGMAVLDDLGIVCGPDQNRERKPHAGEGGSDEKCHAPTGSCSKPADQRIGEEPACMR